MAAESRSAVLKAIVGNFVITLAKAFAATLSGSGAMAAEAIHSLVDTLNQCLLLIGHHRSMMKPTPRFPYGFGAEASFWGLLAAIGILVFGGGYTLQHGISELRHPQLPVQIELAFGVLSCNARAA